MERQAITFSANEQNLIKTGGINDYASNTVGYIVAVFDLGENWDSFDSIRAIFSSDYAEEPAVLAHGSCVVPFEVLRYRSRVRVNLVGSVAEAGVLVDRLTTFPIEALNVTANAKVDNTIAPISPSEFEQFVAMVKDDADRAEAGAESAEDSADAASASAEAAADSALSASNSASNASEDAERVAQMVAEVIAEIEEFEGVTVTVETLPAGSQATSSFADGVLHLGIPRGDKGDQGERGERGETGATGATGATGNGIESVTLTSTSGAVKTYTILFTDGTSTTFEVTDGEVTQAVLDETVSDLKSEINPIREDLLGANITPLSEFYKVTSGISYSVDSANDAVTITCSNGSYQSLSTQNILLTALTAGKKYKAHFKAETISGAPSLRMAIRGVNGNQDGIAAGATLDSDGEGEFEFVANSYMRYVSLFATFSVAQSCVVKYSEVWVKEIEDVTAVDKIAREANEKFTFENPINRFNKSDPLIVNNKQLSYSGVADLSGSSYTHPIPIVAGKKYSFMYSGSFYGDATNSIVRYCTEDGTLDTRGATLATTGTDSKWGKFGTFTAEDYGGSKYVCVNVRTSLINEFMFVEGTALPSEYTDYYPPRYNLADDVGFGALMQESIADAITDGNILSKKNLLLCYDNITCVGDSLTYGVVYTGANQTRRAKRPYPEAIGELTGANIENISEGGVSASEWWASYNSRIESKQNQLVIVYLGTNGGLTDTLETDAPEGTTYESWANTNTGCYAKIVAKAKEAGAKVLLVKVYEPNSINDVIEQIADRFGCGIIGNYRFIDPIYHLYPNGNGSDAVHYNDFGYVSFATYLVYQISIMDFEHLKQLIPD